ncbi:MAG: hypothetical protein AAGF74_12435 [Pseudomonadota bacterium]
MTAEPDAPPSQPPPAIRRWLRWVLVVQAGLAVVLVLSDVQPQWMPRLTVTPPLPEGPVSPGDQRRRYNPAETRPDFTRRPSEPRRAVPGGLPERLEFSVADVDGFGPALFIRGGIAAGDAERFETYVGTLGEVPDIVALNSPGGVVTEALEIGRTLRTRGQTTVMQADTICLSACPYMLAGGVERHVSKRAAVGLHQHYYDAPGYMPVFLAVEGIQHGQGQTMAYLIEMEIDPGLMLYSLNTPPEEIYVLVESELNETRLATHILD